MNSATKYRFCTDIRAPTCPGLNQSLRTWSLEIYATRQSVTTFRWVVTSLIEDPYTL